MNSYIHSLAEEKDVVLVDLYNGLVTNWYWYTNPRWWCYNDQLHPNTLGLQNMATIWYESLADLLKNNTLMPWLLLLLGTP